MRHSARWLSGSYRSGRCYASVSTLCVASFRTPNCTKTMRNAQMSRTSVQQEAHLRVVLQDEGKYQLMLFADLVNFDLYAGPHGVRNKLRSSWHETGKVHIHTPAGRQIGPPRVMPENFTGRNRLYSGGRMGNDWSYRPKPDSSTRRTLLVDKSSVMRGCSCDIWAVEKGREELIEQVLGEYESSNGLELVSFLSVAWTRPRLMAVVSTLKLASWESLMRSQTKAGK